MADTTADPLPTCAFFLARKNRYCKVTLIPGKKYCGLHAHLDPNTEDKDRRNRIPCPLDAKHTVYENQLKKHLKKCNAREKPQPDYFQKNINSGLSCESDPLEKITLSSLSRNELETLIAKLKKVFNDHNVPITSSIKAHPALERELVDPGNGSTALKHLMQTSSLLGNMEKLDLLNSGTCYVEFGAGKGQLSHWVQRSLPDSQDTEFLLVDRGANRYKVSLSRLLSQRVDDGPHFERLRIDIEHLCLDKVPRIAESNRPVVAISKHLCGAATDFTLQCLTETLQHSGKFEDQDYEQSDSHDSKRLKRDSSKRLHGIVIALCCHHKCSWTSYVGREFFQSEDFSPRDFILTTRLTSWATCGTRAQTAAESAVSQNATVPEAEISASDSQNSTEQETINVGYRDLLNSLSVDEREEIGRMSKRLIDIGRIKFLEDKGFKVDLAYYVESKISLENIVMIARPR
ncbi:tRNA:m(4)X modification enzyme TRM13 homolog [Ptychodera flava]|uniref:tRNA:m(4)X modification enzyme TRM13 homolog n=1 Tax=Ptychodera flava TaxID=63121 RepID=UPI003969CB9C